MKINFFEKSSSGFLEQSRTQEAFLSEANSLLMELAGGKTITLHGTKLENTDLGSSILLLQQYIKGLLTKEKSASRLRECLIKVSELVQSTAVNSVEVISSRILSLLAEYISAMYSKIYMLSNETPADLRCVGSFAANQTESEPVLLGEGLVGQCALSEKPIFINEVSGNYFLVSSGLGQTSVKSLVIFPLISESEVTGVIELGAFKEFTEEEKDLIGKIATQIASCFKSIRTNVKIQKLLISSQQKSENLAAQEKQLRSSMEEIEKKNEEIKNQTAESSGLIEGINATMAMIDFTPQGVVLSANDNFLSLMNYTISEIQGKHHQMFVPEEIKTSIQYKKFWKDLSEGKSTAGIFKRIDSGGNTVWLRSIYNPIKNPDGTVTKIIKLATDITKEKEMQALNEGILQGINSTMAIIEFSPDGTILTANENFLTAMEYTLPEISGRHHRMFVPEEIVHTEEYKSFWADLSRGKSVSGTFKRMNANGETVWLRSIYNPIFDSIGNVVKVIKFANNITSEKSAEIQIKELLEEARSQEEGNRQNL